MDVLKLFNTVGDVLGPIDFILNTCRTIIGMAQNAKANKERCQRVAQRVKSLQELVHTIKQRAPGQISVTVQNALQELSTTLAQAKAVVLKFSKTNAVKGFLNNSGIEDKFRQINEKLTDNFQVLSGALQIEHGQVLHKVYEKVSGKKQEEEYYSGQASAISPLSPLSPLSPISPTAPMPPPIPMPVPAVMPPMPPMPVSIPTAPMMLPGPLAPLPVSTTFVPRPAFSAVTSAFISTTMAVKPVIRTAAPVRAPVAAVKYIPQNPSVVGSYVVNSPYY